MSKEEAITLATRIIERWGFPVLVATALGWSLRADLILPLVESHTAFLKELTVTQRDLVNAMNEQTELIRAMQPRTASYSRLGDDPQN